MKSREFPDATVLLQAEPGEDVISAATTWLDARKIHAGSFTGIGACSEAELAFWDPQRREYLKQRLRGPLEILSLVGNVARVEDGKPFLHAHAVLGDGDLQCRGGHVFRLLAEPTCEIVLRPLAGSVERRMVPACGLRLWRL